MPTPELQIARIEELISLLKNKNNNITEEERLFILGQIETLCKFAVRLSRHSL